MGKQSSGVFLVGALVCSGWSCFELTGQTTFGTITGSVLDHSDAVVPDAKITLFNLGTSEQHILMSGGDGEYRFVNLVPGRIPINSRASGVPARGAAAD